VPDQVPIEDVLLYRVGTEGCASPKPKDGDDPGLTALKAFVMTCLHRRNIDEGFEHEMKDWLDRHSFDDLVSKGIIQRLN
jgi:hypothetical protein